MGDSSQGILTNCFALTNGSCPTAEKTEPNGGGFCSSIGTSSLFVVPESNLTRDPKSETVQDGDEVRKSLKSRQITVQLRYGELSQGSTVLIRLALITSLDYTKRAVLKFQQDMQLSKVRSGTRNLERFMFLDNSPSTSTGKEGQNTASESVASTECDPARLT